MLNAVYDKSAWLKEREIDASWAAAGLPEAAHSDNGADGKNIESAAILILAFGRF